MALWASLAAGACLGRAATAGLAGAGAKRGAGAAAGRGAGAALRALVAPTLNTATTSARRCAWSRMEAAAAVVSSTSAAVCGDSGAREATAWLTWLMPSRCSVEEAVISAIRSLTRRTLATISSMLCPAWAT